MRPCRCLAFTREERERAATELACIAAATATAHAGGRLASMARSNLQTQSRHRFVRLISLLNRRGLARKCRAQGTSEFTAGGTIKPNAPLRLIACSVVWNCRYAGQDSRQAPPETDEGGVQHICNSKQRSGYLLRLGLIKQILSSTRFETPPRS